MAMTIEQLEAELERLKAERARVECGKRAKTHWCPAIGDCILTSVAIPIDIYKNLRSRYASLPSVDDYRVKKDDGKSYTFAGFCGARLTDNFDFGNEEECK